MYIQTRGYHVPCSGAGDLSVSFGDKLPGYVAYSTGVLWPTPLPFLFPAFCSYDLSAMAGALANKPSHDHSSFLDPQLHFFAEIICCF